MPPSSLGVQVEGQEEEDMDDEEEEAEEEEDEEEFQVEAPAVAPAQVRNLHTPLFDPHASSVVPQLVQPCTISPPRAMQVSPGRGAGA